MTGEIRFFAILLALLAFGSATRCPMQRTSPGREVLCYTSVIDADLLGDAICKCTTLVHQGHDLRNISASGVEPFRKSLKEIYPALQYVVSVDDPARILRTSATIRQEASARLASVLKEADGIELNVTAGSKERLYHFVKGLKDELVRKSNDKRIFVALSTRSEDLAKQFDLKELSKYVDLFTVATHYLVDDDEAYQTFHPSRMMGLFDMLNTDSLVDLIVGLGAPKRKILISVPASAYRFTLKNEDENAPRSPTVEKDPVIIDRKELCETMSKGEWTIERDEDLTAPYAFKNKTWIAFEDKISVGIKGKYALVRDLAGLGIRNTEHDFQTDCGKPLSHEIHHSFTNLKRKSREAVLSSLEDDLHQQSPISYPNHLKSSDYRVVRVVDTNGHIRAVRETTQTEFTCTRQGYFVHPRSCNRFYRCVKFNQEVEDYSVFEFDCPAGLSFDERTEVCVWPHTLPQGSPCPGSSEIAPVARVRFECPPQPGYYVDPQNCRWFFACIDLGGPQLMAYEFRCPFGLVFDQEKLACEWPWLVPGCSESGSGYTRTEYNVGGYGAGSTSPGTGGYVTGGLPHGYTGPSSGVFHGSSDSGYSGFSGAGYPNAGNVGGYSGDDYSQPSYTGPGGAFGSSGPANVGFGSTSGSTTGGEYSGKEYSGYAGGSHGGTTGTGYSGSTSGTYGGSVDGSYAGSTGSEYTGETSGVYGGSVNSGHDSTVGSGYSGATGGVYGGPIGGGHGSTVGSGYSESTSGIYGGSIGGGRTSTIGSGYSGSTSGVYGGSVGGDRDSTIGSGYSGPTNDVYGGSTGSNYDNTVGSGYSGSTSGIYGGPVGGDHVGATKPEYSSTNGVYSGTSGGGVGGCTGTQCTGYSTGTGLSVDGYTGETYSGATGGSYSGSDTGSYPGSIGTVYSGSSDTSRFQGSSQFTPALSTGSVSYTGSTGSVYTGLDTSVQNEYSGHSVGQSVSTGPGYSVSHGISTEPKYTGSVDSGYSDGGLTSIAVGHSTSSDDLGGSTRHGFVSPGISGKPGYPSSTSFTESPSSISGGTQYIASSTRPPTGLGPFGTQQTIKPIYTSGGTIGTGLHETVDAGFGTRPVSSGVDTTSTLHGQTLGTGFTGNEQDFPGASYLPSSLAISTPGTVSGQTLYTNTKGVTSSIGGGLGTDGYVTSHGTSSGQIYSQQPGIGSTHTGTTYNGRTRFPGSFVKAPGRNGLLNITILQDNMPSRSGSRHRGHNGNFRGYTNGRGTTGTVVTGSTVEGSIFTDDSSSGTLITHGDVSGAILTGTSQQGSVVTGVTQPGFVKTETSTPGYVVSGGVKTIYTDTASPGTYVYGTPSPGIELTGSPAPGITLTGHSSPGVILTGQTSPGVAVGGSIHQGTVVGGITNGQHFSGSTSSTYRGSDTSANAGSATYTGSTRIGSVPVITTPSPDTGYKTNEYHDNGGRGTIKFNNGYVTSKYTENDLPDYRPSIGTIPDVSVSGGRVEGTSGVTLDTIVPGVQTQTARPVSVHTGTSGYTRTQFGTFTPSGFTKTGPTKTGITTATLGGSGSYVISTGVRPTLNPENIGEKAFNGNVAGYTDSSTRVSSSGGTYTSVTSTIAPNIVTSTESQKGGYIDTSKISLGTAGSPGYSYTQPKVPFVTGSVTASSTAPASPTDSGIYIIPATTPTPYLNIEVHNTPAMPSITGSYGTSKGSSVQYTGSRFDSSRTPSGFTNKLSTPTVTPIGFTTGPLENYKTTIFESAKVPIRTSTLQPVYDTGYQTVVSPTLIPVTLTAVDDRFQTGSVTTQAQSVSNAGVSYQHTDFEDQRGPVSATLKPQIQYLPSSTGSPVSKIQGVTSSTITYQQSTGSLRPQNVPSTVSPTVGVTYRKPFPVPGITYEQSTSRPGVTYGSPSGYSYSETSDGTTFDANVNRGYSSTKTTFGSSSGGSPTNLDVPRTEVEKLITNYNNRGTMKYVPSEYDTYTGSDRTKTTGAISSEFSHQQSSSSFSSSSDQSYTRPTGVTQRPLAVTTYSGDYGKVTSVTPTYDIVTKPAIGQGKGKVIVKWSDLHPLLLGKLGAQCTCRGDPFATLRGPGKKLIDSSRGQVDLANYDESDVYVDLENDGSSEYDGDYVTNYGSTSPAPWKISGGETSVRRAIADNRFSDKTSGGIPSSTYLPSVSSTVSSATDTRGYRSSSASGVRSGKNLNGPGSSSNSIDGQGASFNYGPSGELDEVLQSVNDCARPGLFRHPNFCNKFYACHWDEWKKKFTLHVFNCPVHLTFDNSAGACNWPSKGPACQDDNLLV